MRNPWKYKFSSENKIEVEEIVSSGNRLQQGTRQLHTSAKTQASGSKQETRGRHELDDDWFITGGSSGGSAVAVATGACFG